jgi:uncharacterized protein YyaL (SSP411 family)
MKKRLFLIFYLFLPFISFTQNAETFRQWGEESLTVIDTYLKADRGTYLYSEKSSSGYPAFAWPIGIQIKALTYSGRTKDAENLCNDFHNNYYFQQNGYWGYSASYKTYSGSRYYDDNAWIVKDLMDLYFITKKSDYLSRAKVVIKFCMSGEREDGGIRFKEDHSNPDSPDYNKWLTCATAPTAYANLQIYQATNEKKYLDDGLRLYEFMKREGNWGIGPGYRGYENAVVMGVALLLYQITAEQKYLNDAYQLAYSMETHYIAWESGRLNETGQWGGHDMTDAYVELYKIDNNPKWLNIVAGYLIYLHENCKDSNGFYTEEWNGSYAENFNREQLLYQASAASAFMKLATVPVNAEFHKEPVAIFKEINYNRNKEKNCWSMGLNTGSYTQEELRLLGLTDNKFNFKADISSIQITDGYKVTLYQEGDFTGASKIMYRSSEDLKDWSKKVKSIKIESLNNAAYLHEVKNRDKVRLYPSMVKDLLHIENLKINSMLEIKSLTGVSMLKDIALQNNQVVNLIHLPHGIYLFLVRDNENLQVIKFTKIS